MDAMQVEGINWLVPPVTRDPSGAPPAPTFTQPWPDPYTDILDMAPLDPSFTASLEDSIVDPNLLGGFEDPASKAAVDADAELDPAAGAYQLSSVVKEEISTGTSPDLEFFSHPSESNRSSSLITPDSLPQMLPTPPHPNISQHQQLQQLQQLQLQQPQPQPRKRGRPQKRQLPQQQEKSPSKRKRRSPQKTTPTDLSPLIQPDLAAAASSSAASSFSAASSSAVAGPSNEIVPEMSSNADAQMVQGHEEEDEEEGPAQSKRSRIREKNRIAACKCRRKQRKAVSKLTSTHEGLEDLNRQLCGQVSELEAEAFVLKNMLMAHGNCGCEMIQQYFRDAAANLVQKADPAGGGSSSAPRSRARTSETIKSTEA